MGTLYLVRHGEARGNNDEELCRNDRINFLTSFGSLQAQLVGQWMVKHDISIDFMVSSDLTRARQTASIISNYLRYDIPWTIDPRFNEFTDWAPGLETVRGGLHEVLTPMLATGNVMLVSHYYTMRAVFDLLTVEDKVASFKGRKINFCQVFTWNSEEPDRIESADTTR